MNKFENKILLSIKREYSRDEKFSFVLEQLKLAQVENGKLKSDLAEKKYAINKLIYQQVGQEKLIRRLKNKLKLSKRKLSNFNKEIETNSAIKSLRIDKKALAKKFHRYRNDYLNLKLKLDRIQATQPNVQTLL